MTQHGPTGRSGDESTDDVDAFDDLFGAPSDSEPESTAPEAAEMRDDGPETVTMSGAGAPPSRTTPQTHAESDDETVTQAIRRDSLPAADPARHHAPDADVDSVPTGWWSTDPVATPPEHRAPYEQPVHQGYAPPPAQPPGGAYAPPRPPERDRGLGPLAIIALLVGGVLVGATIMLGVTRILGDDEPVAQTASTSTTPPLSSSSPSSTPSPSSSSASEVRRTGELPAGASACGRAKEGTSVARGTKVTSCPFAEEVRDAYLDKDPKGADVNLEVRSPVTGDDYTMRCTGSTVTVCTGGNNAVVYLY